MTDFDIKYCSVRKKGTGTINRRGYVVIGSNGIYKYEHVIAAESVLARSMRKGEEVHHVDGNPTNNSPANLVICSDRSYHQLLHVRERAIDACGNPDWRKCCYCSEYDSIDNLVTYPNRAPRHRSCAIEYYRNWRNKKSAHGK